MPILEHGNDGTLPQGFCEWQRGLTYTLRQLGPPSRINATVRQRVAKGSEFTAYAPLYERAAAIGATRLGELGLQGSRLMHAWFRFEGSSSDSVSASMTFGVDCPERMSAPAAVELEMPGGVTREMLTKEYMEGKHQKLDEIYIDFDMSDPPGSGRDCMLSYGEYVPALEGLDFEPFLDRAEDRARFYHRTSDPDAPFRILRREWWTVTSPNLVAAHIYFHLG
jgi:hypothetical protein